MACEPAGRSRSAPHPRPDLLGALGGIVASRIAREFRFGGPSFVVSGEETSGLRALEIGMRALQQNELDAVLVGAVDLAGDVRSIVAADLVQSFKSGPPVRPFDATADGRLPAEGAAAVVLQRREDVPHRRIYALLKGVGSAGGGGIGSAGNEDVYVRSLSRACRDAGVRGADLSYFETHGSGLPEQDRQEAGALQRYFFNGDQPSTAPFCALGSLKGNLGHAGAAAGLASAIKTCLCLYHEILPPLTNYRQPFADPGWPENVFHMPAAPRYWLRDRREGPRRACAAAMTSDGNCQHVILEGVESAGKDAAGTDLTASNRDSRRHPLGQPAAGLWIVEEDTPDRLAAKLHELHGFVTGRPEASPWDLARRWLQQNPLSADKKYAAAIVADGSSPPAALVAAAQSAVKQGTAVAITARGGVFYEPHPLGSKGGLALVYPGSGNHYPGMGRAVGVQWPEILRELDRADERLKSQWFPQHWMPQRVSWEEGWEAETMEGVRRDPMISIFGQVTYAVAMTRLVKRFCPLPEAVIGYSLGESAGLFALGAWSDRELMMDRMFQSDLFRTQLAGPCLAARQAWRIPPEEPFAWRVAAVRCPAAEVDEILRSRPRLRRLIVNTPDECVIGGNAADLETLLQTTGWDSFPLEGVVAVHCDAAAPVADAYRDLHVFPVKEIPDVRFYSCHGAGAYRLTSAAAADSILQQALHGFDFPRTILQSYQDGARIFLEIGPGASCTRMIGKILDGRPHAALALCQHYEDLLVAVMKTLGALGAHRIPVRLEGLFEKETDGDPAAGTAGQTAIFLGRTRPRPVPPAGPGQMPQKPACTPEKIPVPDAGAQIESKPVDQGDPWSAFARDFRQTVDFTARAHRQFLDFSRQMTETYADAFGFQTRWLEDVLSDPLLTEELSDRSRKDIVPPSRTPDPSAAASRKTFQTAATVAYDRNMCMEFAVGSVARVLGPAFAEVDTYKVRVRLPDEPLMLVDRILSVSGEKGSLTAGTVVTEHDVLPGAWYLDGGRTPVCISVEAGQADLFLCSYLGIDLAVKGKRAYRLLDATIHFHRNLPQPGETIRYVINIEKFARQGETYLFFFNFKGFIGDTLLITMTDGCAGFFTEEEIRRSGGILADESSGPPPRQPDAAAWHPPVPMATESYDDAQIEALRQGDLQQCFGPGFAGIRPATPLLLPGGRMRLIHRVLQLDPAGGRWGLGKIQAAADIHPEDWFLTCHFVDDRVMPGTLMYECCAHTLRVFLQRLGWLPAEPDVCYEPIVGQKAVLKCRGPVTPKTRQVVYEVEIKEIGFRPEPYVVADAHMYADGRYIVRFDGMSMQITGATRKTVEKQWAGRPALEGGMDKDSGSQSVLYDRESILEFAAGSPSKAFGEPYRVFDRERTIARLPRPPYAFMDRVVAAEPPPWVLEPDGWIEAEFDVRPDHWYFAANRLPLMPFCVLLEIALQPCGWLAAYAGSALHSEIDLSFRNLGGKARLQQEILPDNQTLTIRVRMTKVSSAAEMIIEHFDFQVLQGNRTLYDGTTYFGFFSKTALANQVGLRNADAAVYVPSPEEIARAVSRDFANHPPLDPDDTDVAAGSGMSMPSKALRMIDRVEVYVPDGGPHGLGFIRGVKTVDPSEWFFRAHFYQDPVWPGSLGIEAFLQLIKFAARDRWPQLQDTHRFEHLAAEDHEWIYRGQVLPADRRVEVEAVITRATDDPQPVIAADGVLRVDGRNIYKMENFGFKLVEK